MFINSLILIISLLFFLFIVVLVIYLFYKKRGIRIENNLKNITLVNNRNFDDFTIHNPYDGNGNYYKAQLHTHTKQSDGKLEVKDLIKTYKEKNYNFLAITDHNKITINREFDDQKFITIPGEEITIIDPFWPFGRHINRIFTTEKTDKKSLKEVDILLKQDDIDIINHPATESGLGTQRWDIDFLTELNNIRFIEISNHFSKEDSNLKYWHILLNKNGIKNPIWALATDDAHKKSDIDQNWIMVKLNNFSRYNFKESLKSGNFYCTQGPKANFEIDRNLIKVVCKNRYVIKFINAENKIIKSKKSTKASYQARGNEGFIRIEVIDLENNTKLWSQPFWLYKNY